jgi:hypothetical protein
MGKLIRHINFVNKGGFSPPSGTEPTKKIKYYYYSPKPDKDKSSSSDSVSNSASDSGSDSGKSEPASDSGKSEPKVCKYDTSKGDKRPALLGHKVCAQCLHAITGVKVTRCGMKTTRRFAKGEIILKSPSTFNPVIRVETKKSCNEDFNVEWVYGGNGNEPKKGPKKGFKWLKAIKEIKANKILRIRVNVAGTSNKGIIKVPPNFPTLIILNAEDKDPKINTRLDDYQQVYATRDIKAGGNLFLSVNGKKSKTIINLYSYSKKWPSHV